MSTLRPLKFEGFLPEIRLKIYRLLLINEDSNLRFDRSMSTNQISLDENDDSDPKSLESESSDTHQTENGSESSDDRDDDETGGPEEDEEDEDQGESDDETSQAEIADMEFHSLEDFLNDHTPNASWCYMLFPAILRTNSLIHGEAEDVFYKENAFSCYVDGFGLGRLSLLGDSRTTEVAEHHRRLIAKMHIEVGFTDSPECILDDIAGRMKATKSSLQQFCAIFANNRFQQVSIDYFQYPELEETEFDHQRCLEPLKGIRVAKVSI